MDSIILGRLSSSVIRKIGDALVDSVDPVNASVPASTLVTVTPRGTHIAKSGPGNDDEMEIGHGVDMPTAIDELMTTLTRDVVGYISYRLNSALDGEPPRIVDVDVIHKLARDVIARTCADVAHADSGRLFADKCIEAYIYVGEIEAWLKRNVNAKNKEVLTSIASLKEILQVA